MVKINYFIFIPRDSCCVYSAKRLVCSATLKLFLQNIGATSLGAKGILAGIWLSPMLIGVGYIIGPLFIGVWFLGAIIGDFGVVLGGTAWGWWDAGTASAIKSSLGIGLMVGTGVGIIVKGIIPKAKEIFGPMFKKSSMSGEVMSFRWAPIVMVIIAFLFTTIAREL